ncbi:MAG: polysaccharide biosynthesis tyrosine autokinase [Chloroflexota bacterium]
MNIKPFVDPLFRWWWLICLAVLLAASTSYLVTRPLPPLYSARTTLIVGRAISDPNPTGNEFVLARQLAEVYAGLTALEPIRNATMKALNLQALPQYEARTLPNSSLIVIIVTDNNPVLAQAVANELANQLVLQSPTNPQRQELERVEFLNDQLDKLQQEISSTSTEIEEKQSALADATSASQINDLQDQIDALQTKLGILQNNYAILMENTQSGALNTLNVIERAAEPTNPVGPNKKLIILIAVGAAFALSVGVAYLIEYFDHSIRTPEDIAQIMDAPVLGYIPNMERSPSYYDYVAKNPRSPIAEAFRALRTDLGFISIDKPLKTLLVISTAPEDGKTTIASNLAISLAQAENHVFLIESDLRRPNFAASLHVKDRPGLSDALRERLDPEKVLQDWSKPLNVQVVTAGTLPPNPAELLSSRRMEELLQALRERADMLIIDGPPVIVTESVVLASKVDGVLVIIRPGVTTKEDLLALHEQIQRANARVVGVIFNRVSSSSSGRRIYGRYYGRKQKETPDVITAYEYEHDQEMAGLAKTGEGKA